MRKLLLFITIFCLGSSVYATNLSSQAVQVTFRLNAIAGNPNLWLLIKNLDDGSVTPYMIPITSPQMYKLFKTNGSQYQIMALKIQYEGGSVSPCQLTKNIIDNKATRIFLYGSLGPKLPPPECTVAYLNALPLADVKSEMAAQQSSNAKKTNQTDGSKKEPGGKFAEYIKYLKALVTCKAGKFTANVNDQEVTYEINEKSEKQETCDVSINIKGVSKKPIECKFSDDDVALLTSKDQIEMYQSGNIDVEKDSDVAKMMQKKCKA
ncbi:MAG: hypothetical protein ACE365_03060 [Gammaproteobacteria bacterium]